MSDTSASFETTILNPRCSHWMWIAKAEMQADGVCKTVDVSKPKQCKLNHGHAPPCIFDKIIKHKKTRAYKNKPKDLWMSKCVDCKQFTSLKKTGKDKGKCDWCVERGTSYEEYKASLPQKVTIPRETTAGEPPKTSFTFTIAQSATGAHSSQEQSSTGDTNAK